MSPALQPAQSPYSPASAVRLGNSMAKNSASRLSNSSRQEVGGPGFVKSILAPAPGHQSCPRAVWKHRSVSQGLVRRRVVCVGMFQPDHQESIQSRRLRRHHGEGCETLALVRQIREASNMALVIRSASSCLWTRPRSAKSCCGFARKNASVLPAHSMCGGGGRVQRGSRSAPLFWPAHYRSHRHRRQLKSAALLKTSCF